jgi:hypothetical protein
LTDRTGSSGGAGREHPAKAAAAASAIKNLVCLGEGRKAGNVRMEDPVKDKAGRGIRRQRATLGYACAVQGRPGPMEAFDSYY